MKVSFTVFIVPNKHYNGCLSGRYYPGSSKVLIRKHLVGCISVFVAPLNHKSRDSSIIVMIRLDGNQPPLTIDFYAFNNKGTGIGHDGLEYIIASYHVSGNLDHYFNYL